MDVQNKAAINIVRDYGECLDLCFWGDDYDILRLSYAEFAISEIIERIKNENDISPLDALEHFKEQMRAFNSRHKHLMFEVGYETAEEIINVFMS